ncbi:MAG: amidohydrolase family protein [Mycobacteriales bacterium]
MRRSAVPRRDPETAGRTAGCRAGELVEGGYPVAEALAAATSVAAAACGLGRETGRLAEGYAADLLVVDGDLAKDLSVLSAPREVLLRGTPVDLT